MSQTRVKAAAIAPPADLGEAQALLQEIGRLDREVLGLEHVCADRMAEIKHVAEEEATQINGRIAARFRALQAFVEVHRDTLIPKGRESVAWPSGKVGFRKTPLAVSLAKAKLEDIVAALRRLKLSRCLRIKVEIDRDALKAVRAKVEDIDGITFSRRTEFYATPLDAGIEHVGKVKPAKVTKTSGKGKPATLRLDWRLAVLAVAVVALLSAAPPAAGQRIDCDWRDRVIAHLAQKYRERPVAIGVASKGGMVELLTSEGGATWTIIVSTPNGMTCLVGVGEGWRPVLPREEQDPPA